MGQFFCLNASRCAKRRRRSASSDNRLADILTASSQIFRPSFNSGSDTIQRITRPKSSTLRQTGNSGAFCISPHAGKLTPRSEAHSPTERPIKSVSPSAISPLKGSLKPYGRAAQPSLSTGTTSIQTPEGTRNVQSFSGTPVMTWRSESVQPLPMKLFSIHSSELSAVSGRHTSAFWTNMAGWGFTLRCMMARWSRTRFCTASVDEISSRLVP